MPDVGKHLSSFDSLCPATPLLNLFKLLPALASISPQLATVQPVNPLPSPFYCVSGGPTPASICVQSGLAGLPASTHRRVTRSTFA